jgi:nucleoside-diphosphate-sugar epimerase
MKVCVLGSSGQIGHPLSSHLKVLGHQVFQIDLELSPLHDLRVDQNYWKDCISQSDFVFFLAYDVGGSKYLATHEKSREFLDNNCKIMSNVFAQLESTKVPFLFSSSQMSSFGFSPYGTLKRLGEHFTRSLGGINCRFWNVFGPELNIEKAHVITDFIRMGVREKVIKMRTTGDESRQFLYVEDCSTALIALMENYSKLDLVKNYDITSFEWVSIKEIANLISEMTGAQVVRGTATDNVQNSVKNEPERDILKIWSPRYSLSDSLIELIENYERQSNIT